MRKQPKANLLIRAALKEDLGSRGDVTTRFFAPPAARLSGRVVAKQDGIVCGTEVAAAVFKAVDRRCRVKVLVPDGRRVKKGQVVMQVSGSRAILTAERTALNFLQHLSGISTLTAAYATKVRGTRAKIYDTRKTLPGWRTLEKYAVLCGGGENHRLGLYDAVLLKDNHWAHGRNLHHGVRAVRWKYPGMTIEIEAASLSQVRCALDADADIVLLDNMAVPELKRAITLIRRTSPKVQIEISGGVTLKNLRSLAKLGPDRISIGRITHSAPALDLSLELP